MIDNNQRAQLLQVLQSPSWNVIEVMRKDLCDTIQYESKLQPTEWDTLRKVAYDEGQVAGINGFIKKLFNEARNV